MDSGLFHVLISLRDGPAEAGQARARLGELLGADRVTSVPSFYRHLKAALGRGWIEYEPGPASGRGRPGRVYSLTPLGTTALQAEGDRRRRQADWALGDT